MTTPADTLRTAARYLEDHGWCQNTNYTATKAACATGALAAAVAGAPSQPDELTPPQWEEFIEAVEAVLQHLYGPACLLSIGALADWNDDPDRTGDQVVGVLLAAARTSDLYRAAREWDRTHGGEVR